MAVIVSTSVSVYTGTSSSTGTQVGQTITRSGNPPWIDLNISTLGVNLLPGSQYCVKATCINDDQYTAESNDHQFKTKILAELVSVTGGHSNIRPTMLFTYDTHVISVTDCGVYVSTSADGTNAQKYSATDEHTAVSGWNIPVNENTTYYVVPFVVDDVDNGREYRGEWSSAVQVSSGYADPIVTISNTTTTYNNISGNVTVTSNTTISSVVLQIQGTAQGSPVYTKTITAQTGTQNFSITNGDLDDNNTPIVIQQSTEYRITATATDGTGQTGTHSVTAMTKSQSTSTINIDTVDPITPTTARVNLIYGPTGGGVQTGDNPNQ